MIYLANPVLKQDERQKMWHGKNIMRKLIKQEIPFILIIIE